jgi:hypothetical protein
MSKLTALCWGYPEQPVAQTANPLGYSMQCSPPRAPLTALSRAWRQVGGVRHHTRLREKAVPAQPAHAAEHMGMTSKVPPLFAAGKYAATATYALAIYPIFPIQYTKILTIRQDLQ